MRVAFALAVPVLAAALFAACGTDYADDPKPDGGADGAADSAFEGAPAAESGKSNAAPCATNAECISLHCVDAVCCDSACDGVCESCNFGSQAGHCSAIPDGENPDKECAAQPQDPDAGAASGADASAMFVFPPTTPTPSHPELCAGTCNGQRACKFGGQDVRCGDSFCGDRAEEGREVCDGQGNCVITIASCTSNSCKDGAPGCGTTCTKPSDCLDTHYCDGATNTCKPRTANGVSCNNAVSCQSNNCIDGVCCNAPCGDVPGGSCASPGHMGECTCSACSTGPCQLFYRDADGDGFGDMSATLQNNGAKFACAAAPPTGFVADNTDCFDSNVPVAGSVHPGQTTFFMVGYTVPGASVPSFDYNCTGKPEMETATNVRCGICALHIIPQSVPVGCPPYTFENKCTAINQATGHACNCQPDNSPFFPDSVDCGKQAEAFTCDACAKASGSPDTIDRGLKTQRCH